MLAQLPDPVALLVVFFGLSLIPFIALLATSFTKLIIVFGLLRQALGLQQTPPNMLINALAIVLTFHIMAPLLQDGWQEVSVIMNRSTPLKFSDVERVMEKVTPPLKEFLTAHTRPKEKLFFEKSANELWKKDNKFQPTGDDLRILIPSFTLSELTAAFEIGFLIFLVFVVVDFVIAGILLSLGMAMLPPTTISIPLKILLFVALDGWSLLVHTLVMSYKT